MIAELHGKISGSGSNLNDRLEDKLTGDVFGALRYMPFHLGMAQILRAAKIDGLTECVEKTKLDFWGDRIQFWPYHEEGEMDAFLELDNAVISIEVKYMSGLSSDDEIENTAKEEKEESHNQLARESRMVRQWCPAHKKPYLIFIAHESECAPICNNVKARAILEPGVELGYVSWQEILNQLSQVEATEPYQRLILSDLVSLLKRKGFERFSGFDLSEDLKVTMDEYYCYGYNGQAHTETGICFDYPEAVIGGSFYEYR
ncbi:MAG: hypothetical protein ACI3XJ_01340 [Oscillospiraceae bacterium]